MTIHTFIKEGAQWFIDLPEYIANGGAKGDLQMVEGADTMLDNIAAGSDRVTLALDRAAFDGADLLTLVELCDPVIGGGIYNLEFFEGNKVSQQMWLCAVTQFVFGDMPEKIFLKRVTP